MSNITTQLKPEELYRYTSIVTDEMDLFTGHVPVELNLTAYPIIKYTPKGYWITCPWDIGQSKWKWVSASARKRFAYPTKRLALESFKKRKSVQLSILAFQTAHAKEAMKLAKLQLDLMD